MPRLPIVSARFLPLPLLAVLAFAGLAFAGLTAHPAAAEEGYSVGIGDLLSISIFAGAGTEPIVFEARVAGDGTIDVAHLGPYAVAGQATGAIRDGIREGLVKAGIFRAPQVAVNITEYRSQGVNVGGLVNEAGRYYLEGPTRLLDILSAAKGVKEAEASSEVHVIREGQADPLRIKRADLYAMDPAVRERANIFVRAGDTVHVPRLAQFCIMGPVVKPGCYDHRAGITLEEALSTAEGLDTTKADRHAITIRRSSGGGMVEFTADLTDTGPTGSRFVVEEADQIVVGEAVLTVTVEGTVAEPGKKDWVQEMTITDAIAEAKGHEAAYASGNLAKVILRRGGEVREINVKDIQRGKAPDVMILPGDKIFVPRKRM